MRNKAIYLHMVFGLIIIACLLCSSPAYAYEYEIDANSTENVELVMYAGEAEELEIKEEPRMDAETIRTAVPDSLYTAKEIISWPASGNYSVWYELKLGDGVVGYVPENSLISGTELQSYLLDKETVFARATNPDLELAEEKYPVLMILSDSVAIEVEGDILILSKDDVEFEIELGTDSLRAEMVEYAKQFLGNPYVWGGTSLTEGCDCSGFVMRIYEHFGMDLPRTSQEQALVGTRISLEEALPGDLAFYMDDSGDVYHVVLVAEDDQTVEAQSSKTGIVMDDIGSAAFAVRLIDDSATVQVNF